MPSPLAEADHRHLWHPFTQQSRWTGVDPLIVERAEGCWLIDIEGRRYLDGVSSLWTNVHGHRHPAIDAAIRAQLDRVAHSTMLGLTHPPAIELAAALTRVTGLDRVFYSDNGSTAAEVALKMAFQAQQHAGQAQRTRFASLRDAYHGDTIGAVSVGAIDLFHQIFRPLLFDAVALPAPVSPGGDEEAACLDAALKRLDAHADTLAAIIVEPLVQGAAGMKMHTPAYLRPLLERAREHGLLIIADEVATGFARTGTMFSMEQVGIQPDLLCLAKGLAGGYLPLAATVTTEAVYERFLGAPTASRQFFHGHTFTGNPLACAAALASLSLLEDGGLTRANAVADGLGGRLARLDHPHIREVRRRGVMVGIDLAEADGTALPAERQTGHRVCMATREHGLILRPLGDTVVINPPLVLDNAELDHLFEALGAALSDVFEGGG